MASSLSNLLNSLTKEFIQLNVNMYITVKIVKHVELDIRM